VSLTFTGEADRGHVTVTEQLMQRQVVASIGSIRCLTDAHEDGVTTFGAAIRNESVVNGRLWPPPANIISQELSNLLRLEALQGGQEAFDYLSVV
jgi:hypothetical protein